MAAGILPKPGSRLGPCIKKCGHIDCKETLASAATTCRICSEPIGYGTRFIRDPEDVNGSAHHDRALLHERCYEDWLDSLEPPDAADLGER